MSAFDPLKIPVALIPQKEFASRQKGGVPMAVTSLRTAIETRFDESALFCTYLVEGMPEGWHRLRKHGSDLHELRAQGKQVVTTCLVFDYDRPKKNGAKNPWESPDEPLALLMRLFEADLRPTAFYTTMHGARMVYVLDQPVLVEDGERAYQAMLGLLAKAGIHSDENTADWTRFFYLPYVTKEGQPLWKNECIWHEFFGDVTSAKWILQQSRTPDKLQLDDGDVPEAAQCDLLLEVINASGKLVQTDFVRQAKKALQNSTWFDIVFNSSPPPWPEGERNTGLWKLVGHVTQRLWGKVEGLTPTHIYALLRPTAKQMPPSPDDGIPYVEKLWEMVCRTYEKRHNDSAVERASVEEVLERALEGFRRQCILDGQDPQALAARQGLSEVDYMRQHLIALAGRGGEVYLMQEDGSYTTQPIGTMGLQGNIKHMGLEDLYGLYGSDGEILGKDELLKLRSFQIAHIEMSVNERVGRLKDIDQPAPTLVLPAYWLLDEDPVYSPVVDEYLRVLGGDDYERLVDWLTFAQVPERPICALSLCGTPGVGKTFIAELLGARFGPGKRNNETVLGEHNSGLTRNPVIAIDEGVRALRGTKAIDEVFRTYVTGGVITVSEKYQIARQVEVYPRVIIAANNRTALQQTVAGRDLDDDSFQALTERILHIQVGPAAKEWLARKGGRNFTSDWIEGKRIALKHLAFLYRNRPEKSRWAGQGRLLVEGRKDDVTITNLRWTTPQSEAVMRAIMRALHRNDDMPEDANVVHRKAWFRGHLLVSGNSLYEYVKRFMDYELKDVKLNGQAIKKALDALCSYSSAHDHRVGRNDRRRWKVVDPHKLMAFALDQGMDPMPLEKWYVGSYGQAAFDAVLDFGLPRVPPKSVFVAPEDDEENEAA
jgi:hypothetical protein